MNLRERLAAPGIVPPGVYDAFTAMLAERAGFEALYLSDASVAYTRIGRPDIGLVTETELEETLSRITERVTRPVIVERLGFAIALFPGGTARAAAFAFAEYFASLKAHGTTAPYRGRMLDFDELQRLLGTADMLALGRRYDDSNAS